VYKIAGMEKLVDFCLLKIKGIIADIVNGPPSTDNSRVVVGMGLGCDFNTFLVTDCS
jgi:hypothetical protein